MRGALVRLAGLVTALVLLGLVTAAFLPVSTTGLRAAIAPFGPFAPVAFVAAGGVLGMAFVPGPLLAAASGVLFGTGPGFVVTVASATLTSVLALLVARRSGARAVDELAGERIAALVDLARRRGLAAVVLQRLTPGVPDAPLSYAFGLLRLRVWQIALGTVIGAAPRAFSYTALGDAAVRGDARLAVVAVAVAVLVSAVGIVAGAVLVRRRRAPAGPAAPGPGNGLG